MLNLELEIKWNNQRVEEMNCLGVRTSGKGKAKGEGELTEYDESISYVCMKTEG
jgi:hypothetical protein